MKQGVVPSAATALLMFVSLGSEIVEAAEGGENNERGFYMGVGASRAEHDVQGEGQMFVGVSGPFGFVVALFPDQVEIDDTQTGWNVTLGYRINRYFAAELAYHDFGEASVVERYFPDFFPLPVQIAVRSNIQAYGPSVSLLGTLPVTSSLDLFARGGVLFLDHEVERQQAQFRTTRRTGQEIWIAGVGAQWSFTSRWAARLEYQLTDTIDRDQSQLPAPAGTNEIGQVSLSVLFDF